MSTTLPHYVETRPGVFVNDVCFELVVGRTDATLGGLTVATEPTIADVLARLDRLSLEIRATGAELRLDIIKLTQAAHDRGNLSHSHPGERP